MVIFHQQKEETNRLKHNVLQFMKQRHIDLSVSKKQQQQIFKNLNVIKLVITDGEFHISMNQIKKQISEKFNLYLKKLRNNEVPTELTI